MVAVAALTIEELRKEISSGEIDTVVIAMTDMQGRLVGKRIAGQFFVDEIVKHGTEGCNYLLAVDVDMNTVRGYDVSSWDTGYGDMVMRPDLSTLHRVPWQPGTVGVLCDLETEEGDPVAPSPRQVLRRQLDALRVAIQSARNEFGVAAHFDPAMSAEGMHAPQLARDEYRAEITRDAAAELKQHGRGVVHVDGRLEFSARAVRVDLGYQPAKIDHGIKRMDAARRHAAGRRFGARGAPVVL